MSEGLPKLVVERLRTAEAGAHPDADLLTAFAEKTLSSRERGLVMQHLAACADCREIVALAIPEQRVTTPSWRARASWLTWPYLRWGAALACVVVVGAAVTLRQQRYATQAKMAPTKAAEPAAPQPSYELRNERIAAAQEANREISTGLEKSKKDSVTRQTIQKTPAAPALEAKPPELSLQGREVYSLDQLAAATARTDKAPARAKEQNAPSVAGAAPVAVDEKAELDQRRYLKMAPAPMVASSETVVVEGEAVQTRNQPASAQKSQPQYSFSTKKATKSVAAGNVGKVADAGMSANLVSTTPPLGARWTLSPEGVLQRSLDSGTTWTPVAVAPNLALRAVSALGNDIWVGGGGGGLFHSVDNGMHWIQVRPSFEGKALTGDIIGVEFKDLSHGQLTTTYEIWTTNDAGKTWSRTQK